MNATAAAARTALSLECQHAFQVFGGGRHCCFYELDDPRWERPVMTRLCPSCERQLLRAIGAVLVAAGAIRALQAVV